MAPHLLALPAFRLRFFARGPTVKPQMDCNGTSIGDDSLRCTDTTIGILRLPSIDGHAEYVRSFIGPLRTHIHVQDDPVIAACRCHIDWRKLFAVSLLHGLDSRCIMSI